MAEVTDKPQERVLVVGGSSRIGLAVARQFARKGALVTATRFKSKAPDDIEGLSWVQLDVTDESGISNFAIYLGKEQVGFDVVVIVTGSIAGKKLSDYSFAEVDSIMSVNFNGPVKILSALLPFLNDGSRVVMFSSISGERGSFDPVYAAAKGALVSFVKSMAVQLAPRTRFVAIAPGLVAGSGMFDSMSPERRAFHCQATPLGRLVEPEELAAIVHDLTQPHWAHANGTCVRINGGSYV